MIIRDATDGEGGDHGPGFLGGILASADDRSRIILGSVIGAVLLLLLIVFFVNRAGGDGGNEPTSVPTSQSVLGPTVPAAGAQTSGTSTPASTKPSTLPRQPTAGPTETPRRGGDNQRDQDGDGNSTQTPEGSLDPAASDPLANVKLGPVAKSCPKACILRVSDVTGLDEILSTARTRPSFAAGGWSWVVASRQGTGYIEARTQTVMVSKHPNTLHSYVIRLPEGQADDSSVASFGTILDSAGAFRVVEVGTVPARVGSLIDLGFKVYKMAPGPPVDRASTNERVPLANVEIGELIDEVDPGRLEAIIQELQATSSTDGSGVGTRYYSEPGNAMASEYLYQHLESYGIKVWYEDFLTPEGILLVNVVAEIPGEDAGAMYGVLAHFDTISSNIGAAPGADDNATGVAASLEIARILSSYGLNHPVRLIFINAEEVGIIGSDVWARKIVADHVPMEGVFNMDSVGSDRQGNLIILNGDAGSAWMQDLMVRVNDAYGLGQELAPRQNPNIVADDNMLRAQGLESVLIARELYGFSPVHHSPEDIINHVSIANDQSATQLVLLSVAALVQ